jgi:DNA recombination protein RmuC
MTDIGYMAVGAGVGVLVGGAIAWLLAAQRGRNAAHAEIESLKNEHHLMLEDSAKALEEARSRIGEISTEGARMEAQLEAAENLRVEEKLANQRALELARESHEKALADMREAFTALSAKALHSANERFIQQANENFQKHHERAQGDLEKRQQSIGSLLKPLEGQLKQYQDRMGQTDTRQSSAIGEVKKHLETLATQSQSLASETIQLRQILGSNQARGRWGEETLRRVVEAAGMSSHCDFHEQTVAGDAKPDMTVHLPGERMIIVDSKVPDLEFLNTLSEADDTRRKETLVAHAAKLKSTIKALNDRNYPEQFSNALDHVVLFLPAESLFSAALEGDSDLIIWAQQRKILLATPASLIALLRSVSLSWQQHAQTENAQKIATAAQDLFKRVQVFVGHLDGIRKGLTSATTAYNKAVGSYERSVRPGGQKLKELGGTPDKQQLSEMGDIAEPLRLPPDSGTIEE